MCRLSKVTTDFKTPVFYGSDRHNQHFVILQGLEWNGNSFLCSPKVLLPRPKLAIAQFGGSRNKLKTQNCHGISFQVTVGYAHIHYPFRGLVSPLLTNISQIFTHFKLCFWSPPTPERKNSLTTGSATVCVSCLVPRSNIHSTFSLFFCWFFFERGLEITVKLQLDS